MPNIGEANGCAGTIVEIRPSIPAICTTPLWSTATLWPAVPEGNSAEYKSDDPSGFNSARKSPIPLPLNTEALIGKPAELVPASHTSSELSRLIELARSGPGPPRYVAHLVVPAGLSSMAKASVALAARLVW